MIHKIKIKIRNLSRKNKIVRKFYLIANRIKTTLFSSASDETYAKIHYKENTGKTLNLKNPKLFNEKIWWLKLNNRDPLLTKCSDKILVRDYVKSKISCDNDSILNEVYGIYNSAEEINFDSLPDKAFIKVNHRSGTSKLWDRNNPFDKRKFIKEFNQSLRQNYFKQSREWNYKNIEPKIIVERVLENSDNKPLIDYKFLCFDGVVKLLIVEMGIAADDGSQNPSSKRNIYDRDFNYLPIKIAKEKFDPSLVSKPVNYEKMIEYAEILAAPFVFCRVDLYNINDGDIYFGEITFYSDGGCGKIEPEEWELKMGEWIDLKSTKIKLKGNNQL